jgi:hypothetical protein
VVYGSKLVLPTNLDYEALRVMAYKEQEAMKFLEDAIDQLDAARNVSLSQVPTSAMLVP